MIGCFTVNPQVILFYKKRKLEEKFIMLWIMKYSFLEFFASRLRGIIIYYK